MDLAEIREYFPKTRGHGTNIMHCIYDCSTEREAWNKCSSFYTVLRCQCHSRMILIDHWCSKNFISEASVSKLNLETDLHPSPYPFYWVNKRTLQVTKRCLVPIQFGDSLIEVWCDVLPMRVIQIVLGYPWIKESNVKYKEMENQFSFQWDHINLVLRPGQKRIISPVMHSKLMSVPKESLSSGPPLIDHSGVPQENENCHVSLHMSLVVMDAQKEVEHETMPLEETDLKADSHGSFVEFVMPPAVEHPTYVSRFLSRLRVDMPTVDVMNVPIIDFVLPPDHDTSKADLLCYMCGPSILLII